MTTRNHLTRDALIDAIGDEARTVFLHKRRLRTTMPVRTAHERGMLDAALRAADDAWWHRWREAFAYKDHERFPHEHTSTGGVFRMPTTPLGTTVAEQIGITQ